MNQITRISDGSSAQPASPRYTVTDLSILPGCESSSAKKLNDRGQIIGSLYRENNGEDPSGFLWSDGKMRDLGKVSLNGINNKGQIAGTKHARPSKFSVALSEGGRFQELLKNTSASSMARDINDYGQVVGSLQSTKWKHPADIRRGCFVWEKGKRRYLEVSEGYRVGDAVAINNHGLIVGELWKNGPVDTHACLWNASEVAIFEEPPSFNQSIAIAVNNQGQVLVRAFRSDFKELFEYLNEGEPEWRFGDAVDVESEIILYQQKIDALPKDTFVFSVQHFLWQNNEIQAIDGLAEAVSDSGEVVGQCVGRTGLILTSEDIACAERCKEPYAFFWQNGEALDLNDLIVPNSGWHLTKANDINNKGQIVGYGEIDGKTRAFLLTPAINP